MWRDRDFRDDRVKYLFWSLGFNSCLCWFCGNGAHVPGECGNKQPISSNLSEIFSWDHCLSPLHHETHRVNISEVVHLLSRSILTSTSSRTSENVTVSRWRNSNGLKTWSHWDLETWVPDPLTKLSWESGWLSLIFDLLRLTNKRCLGWRAVSDLFWGHVTHFFHGGSWGCPSSGGIHSLTR